MRVWHWAKFRRYPLIVGVLATGLLALALLQFHASRTSGTGEPRSRGAILDPSQRALPPSPLDSNDVPAKAPPTPELELCPEVTSGGPIEPNGSVPSWQDLEARFTNLKEGGRWRPTQCRERHRVAVIVPYRDRDQSLRLFLQHIHPFLQAQNLNYGIYVTEQSGDNEFNRGLARNVGFLESQRLDGSDCANFHDVDLLPLDSRNDYGCPRSPRHLCVAVDYYEHFKPLYIDDYAVFGGVVAMSNHHFKAANGYSNLYFGWGAEDDDLRHRIGTLGFSPLRYADDIGRYYGIPHKTHEFKASGFTKIDKFKIFRVSTERLQWDGLNTTRYSVLKVERNNLFTKILFDVKEKPTYEKETHQALDVYHSLYGSLTPYWRKLPFTPRPRWWEGEPKVPDKFMKFRPKN